MFFVNPQGLTVIPAMHSEISSSMLCTPKSFILAQSHMHISHCGAGQSYCGKGLLSLYRVLEG